MELFYHILVSSGTIWIIRKYLRLNMNTYKVRVNPKGSSEVNICRVLQGLDFLQSGAELEELKQTSQSKTQEGPQKSEAYIKSRLQRDQKVIPEFVMKSDKQGKKRTWRGRSDESGKYAIMYWDNNELKMFLVDHWYKFCPIISETPELRAEVPKEIALGSEKRKRDEQRITQEIFGEDSEEEVAPTKRRRQVIAEDDDTKAAEGMDYDDVFDDDEGEILSDEEEQIESTVVRNRLTESGRELQKVLDIEAEEESPEDISGEDDLGLYSSDEEPPAQIPFNQQGLVNELLRLGKVKLAELIAAIRRKFNIASDNNWFNHLQNMLRDVADVCEENGEAFVLLKEEYKKTMPSHGARIHFQTL
jgi:hypothetical protein